MGRHFRRPITREQAQQWLDLVKGGAKIKDAADAVGVTLTSLGRYEAVDPEIHEMYVEGREFYEESKAAQAEDRVEELAMGPDWTSPLVLAHAKAFSPRYADKTQVEISGPNQGPLEGNVEIGIAEVFKLFNGRAGELLESEREGLESPRKSLPPARDVLSDSEEPEPPTDLLPAA